MHAHTYTNHKRRRSREKEKKKNLYTYTHFLIHRLFSCSEAYTTYPCDMRKNERNTGTE